MSQFRVVLWLFFFGTTVFSSGCVYTKNRLRDAADVFGVGAGLGYGASVRATEYLQSAGLFRAGGFKTVGRTVYPRLYVAGEYGLAPIFHFRASHVDEQTKESRAMVLGKTLLDASDRDAWHQWYDGSKWSFFPKPSEFSHNYDRRFLDLGVSLYLIVGFDLDLSVIELVDFLLGLVGLDACQDDLPGDTVGWSAEGDDGPDM